MCKRLNIETLLVEGNYCKAVVETCCTVCPVGGRHVSSFILTRFSTSCLENFAVLPLWLLSCTFHCLPLVVCICVLLLVKPSSGMFSHSTQKFFSGLCSLCTLSALLLSVSGENVFESRSGMIQELRAALADLAGEGRTYLGKLAGEQTVLSVQKAFSQVLGVIAGSLASGVNVLLQYVTHFLQAAGIQVGIPVNKVTPEGLIFVAQWVLMALIGYCLISLAFRLVASTLRRALWLLKVGVALACFGLILSDHSVGTETMAVRLAVLVCICVLLGVGTVRGSNVEDKTTHLAEQVKILERRLREMERSRRTEE
ncbi:transmembrane protein 109 [Thunnus albacares]|uniref:transmembrane protein 109 n=1 Tax=Thunnus albacares TaxID=8236 RepID=UPI001CF6D4E5|nr:transmembrane protein 109 [Thunnus albacares]